ncbi:hypothetical protein K523DRAFT_240756 [Schizophyllum commune Tattone D]|nr:hypothetical protein K523DRAFT_240756 [Schizophyllum commune Tattone D]
MSSISSLETITAGDGPQKLQTPVKQAPAAAGKQVPPSPAEEDLSRAHAWHEDTESEEAHVSPKRKGKERSPSTDTEGDDDEFERSGSGSSYPPINDEEAETRRVEEVSNLLPAREPCLIRARESVNGSAGDRSSLVSAVARRASMLFSGSSTRSPPRPPTGGPLGNHRALQSRDSLDASMPLDDIATPTPSPTFNEHRRRPDDDPFADPAQTGPVMEPLAEVPDASTAAGPTPDGPVLLARRESTLRHAPTPKPLDLPLPRTPPPIHTPPTPITPINASSRSSPEVEDEPVIATRWWHEWLCGCGEGPDRGGDQQAGRTNPNE